MTTTTQRPTRGGSTSLGAGMLPQVNLLPPEVRAARGLAVTKRILAAALVGVLLLAGVGYAAALAVSTSATDHLATVQDETVALQAEEAKYAEVPTVVNSLKRAKEVRTLGMSTEIQWKGYLDALTAVIPPDVSIESMTIDQENPSAGGPVSLDAVNAQGVATITMTGRAKTLVDASAWIDALNSVPTFYGATFGTETLEDKDGTTGYSVTSTVLVNEGAFSHRFTNQTEGK